MDLYEVHVPCGQKVVVICKETGEDVKILKNGKPIYKDNDHENQATTTATVPQASKTPADNNSTTPTQTATAAPDEEDSESTVEPNMTGGKKSRRNNARKNNATRRKQTGGKRAPNRYMKFANKIRPQIIKEHPELKSDVVGVARKIGEKWRALSDAEKKKY